MGRRAISIAMMVTLAGCSDQQGDDARLDRFALQWTDLKDGSKFAHLVITDGDRSEAIRCWPKAASGFECLRVNHKRLGVIDPYTVSKEEPDQLPDMSMAIGAPGPGYSCGYVMGYSEQIERGGATLTSNSIDYTTPRWTRSFVNRYMADNAVEGTAYFRCLDVLDAVKKGSLKTLGTTSVTRAALR